MAVRSNHTTGQHTTTWRSDQTIPPVSKVGLAEHWYGEKKIKEEEEDDDDDDDEEEEEERKRKKGEKKKKKRRKKKKKKRKKKRSLLECYRMFGLLESCRFASANYVSS